MRIIHPNHPLTNQVVPVVRAIHIQDPTKASWVIQLPDGERMRIPQTWTTSERNRAVGLITR